ncbi:hypothetical protein BH23GEM9_BH23GEM9_12070 [soil metagenome]
MRELARLRPAGTGGAFLQLDVWRWKRYHPRASYPSDAARNRTYLVSGPNS